MMDTQETNLPKDEKAQAENTGKLEETQALEMDSVETTQAQNSVEAITTEPEVVPEAKAAEAISEPEAAIAEPEAQVEVVSEPKVTVEPEAAAELVSAPKADAVPEPAVETAATALGGGATPEPETGAFEADSSDDLSDSLLTDEVPDEGDIIPLDTAALAAMTKIQLIERLEKVVEEPRKYARHEADMLKHAYYKIRRVETEAEKKAFLEGGNEDASFVPSVDDTEAQVKTLMIRYKEKRASLAAEEERQKEANLILKQHLIERLKILTESQDDFNKRYNEFREIQKKWKEVRLIPQEHARELWRNYQLYNERFYDIVKINNQFRDYDFKKNLEMKTALCETVERLEQESDVISAFHQLQKLHQQWREIGPVAKEFRESIWERFKEASTVVNKRHQTHFESLKAQEEKNLEEKTAICEKIESIPFESLKTMKDWEKKTEEVIALQSEWRKIGFATKKQNVKVFERFRAACDLYFNKKSEFYKSIKQDMDKNLELKKALVEKAESMKEDTDWKETTKAFVELQSEWKKIGPVARKHSEAVWRQFISACDYFFEQKNKEVSSQKKDELENLEAKKALVEKIETIDKELPDDEALSLLRGYITEWNSIGFVPFKEKDKIYKLFREAADKQFDRLKVNERDRRVQQFRSNLTELAESGKSKLYNERDKLMRVYDRMKNELQTYENNIGFFNVSSKGGDGLMKEMDRKIERLKEEMEVVVKKIEAIDEKLD